MTALRLNDRSDRRSVRVPFPGMPVLLRSLNIGTRALIVLFMLGPLITIAVLSFGEETTLVFPPQHWGFGLYKQFFESHSWIEAILTSARIGVPAAVLALLVAGPAAWALSRTRMPLRGLTQTLGIAPLLLPTISYAIALYAMYLKSNLLYTTGGLILADSVLAVPFVLLILKSAIDRIPPDLELVAMSLGATRRRAVWDVTIRMLKPAIFAALLFGFMISFDESTFVQFLGGPGQTTLPKAIFDSVRTGLQPVILAIATILVCFSVAVTVAVAALRKGSSTEAK